jgi:GH15 family glucan-1,4-alpha-glucosidase
VRSAVAGARRLPETELDHLPGYADSRPVRVGNGAVDQQQHDVLGEVMDALQHVREAGDDADGNAWSLQRALVNELADHWDEPDRGMWEIRGEPQHFVHSKVMVWVAFDRAVRAVEQHGLEGDVERWRDIRDRLREEVLERGYDEERGSFVQHYDTRDVDAALLQLPAFGFVDGDDPRMLGTIRAIEEDLLRDGLVLRYDTSSGVDGLECDENPFLACSFWLVSAYAGAGRLDDAHALFDRLVGLTNDVGLLAEEYAPDQERMAGNFPQAFSHLALVQAAFDLADAR